MQRKNVIGVFIAVALLLMIPLLAMQFNSGFVWSLGDFIIAGILLLGAGLTYEFVSSRSKSIIYRFAVAGAIGSSLFLIWANLAVGLIGNENNPANVLFYLVIMVGIVGAILSRLKSRGMARTMFAMATTQVLVPVVAFLIWRPEFNAGVVQVFGVTVFFAFLFSASGLLFLQASTADPVKS
ncbi:hypothetical protein CVU83_03505 [Candidatus Falkowbacteria bacterium HGW-Falkowbacteria-2]|uniref:Uncharacterized protein n=1 Tax=Candidatus Falkowbacteria bacterium HGW-Falkowbacteria-2 TaxID=2013769 RepID=A0A2N2DX08_9BACT|nr:MAG: hypothetical protein CVU83_03505 [Candidatus Falkowbacteria bacterium HGW-Falkowbacteria-2]